MDNQEKKTNNEKKENTNDLIAIKNIKIENLKSQLLNNKNKINDIKLRKLANIENIKKNTKIKITNIKQEETEKFFKKIIPIIDSLEEIITLSHASKIKNTPLMQGIELTLQSLFKILYKLGVKIEGQKNELFNPNIHDSIATEQSETIESNHIISINKKGFTFNKKLLRKAQVIICKN